MIIDLILLFKLIVVLYFKRKLGIIKSDASDFHVIDFIVKEDPNYLFS